MAESVYAHTHTYTHTHTKFVLQLMISAVSFGAPSGSYYVD